MNGFLLIAGGSIVAGAGLAIVACGGDSNANNDGGSGGADAAVESSVEYTGPVRGGRSTPGDRLTPEPGTMGPVDAAIPCCPTQMTFVAAAGGSVAIRGKSPPFDGAGVAMTHNGTQWIAPICFPVGTNLKYRFAVTNDGGEVFTADPRVDSVEDENGDAWNERRIESCDELSGDGG